MLTHGRINAWGVGILAIAMVIIMAAQELRQTIGS